MGAPSVRLNHPSNGFGIRNRTRPLSGVGDSNGRLLELTVGDSPSTDFGFGIALTRSLEWETQMGDYGGLQWETQCGGLQWETQYGADSGGLSMGAYSGRLKWETMGAYSGRLSMGAYSGRQSHPSHGRIWDLDTYSLVLKKNIEDPVTKALLG